MKIIIIDDSKMMLTMAEKLLYENLYRIEIETFKNPVEALERIRKSNVDLVITDLIMKEMNGIEVVKEIKGNKKLEHIKVLIVTSIMDYDTLMKCYEYGASDYILKPFNKNELIARVRNALREISLQKKLAGRLEDINYQHEKLKEANEKLKVTQSALIQKEQLAGIGQLAAGVAHEMNNPLGFIISNFNMLNQYVEIFLKLMNKYDDLELEDENIKKFKLENDYDFIIDDFSELLSDTNSGLARLKDIVKSLKGFSRINDFKELTEFDINEGIRETLIITKNEYKYIADVETNFAEIPKIQAFGGEINQVFLNLIVNGVYAIKKMVDKADKENKDVERGKITIKTSEISDYVVIEFTDNGCGMKKEVLTKIFNPFYTTKPIGTGTGLGLSISYDVITNKHNGRIEVDSIVDVGTTFTIYLPKYQKKTND